MDGFRSKVWLNWHMIRAHICTIAVSLSFNSTWRVPRECFRYGAFPYLVAYTMALVFATPATMLHLATGQLSQQDAVGVWGAVPFFTGIGYIKLLTSFLSSVVTVIYVSLTTILCLYTLRHSIPFSECIQMWDPEDVSVQPVNASECLDLTFLAPVHERPEYFIAMFLIIIITWIIFPFYLCNPIKSMKISLYTLCPVVLLLGSVIVSCIGESAGIELLHYTEDWMSFTDPYIWLSAISQALISSQLSGGYLISAADTLYSSNNVVWASLGFVVSNVLAGWLSVMFWFSIGPTEHNEINPVSVLTLIYNTSAKRSLHTTWPSLMLIMLIISGIITLITLLYPIYDRCRRVMYDQWRTIALCTSVVGTTGSLVVLLGSYQGIGLLEEIAIPFLVNISVTIEILVFIFIYGWRTLVMDVEFLTRQTLSKFWVIGWCVTPPVIMPFTVWWMTRIFTDEEHQWQIISLSCTIFLASVIFIILACLTVALQVHFDYSLKVKSSFKPSRHWGPRDPIANYYWHSYRQEIGANSLPPTAYVEWRMGDISGESFLDISDKSISQCPGFDDKPRANSDGLFWTMKRKEHLSLNEDKAYYYKERVRSKSLDLTQVYSNKSRLQSVLILTPFDIHASSGKIAIVDQINTHVMDSKEDNNGIV